MRRVLIPALAITALVGGGIAWTASSASSATAPTLSLTVAGTDMHSLDPHLEPMFIAGGGVLGIDVDSSGVIKNRYFETGLDLPVGAKLTSISVVGRDCFEAAPTLILGSYSPATRGATQNVTLSFPAVDKCAIRTMTKTANPITTTVAGRRYALDYAVNSAGAYPGYEDQDAFYGATIKYTCTSPCVP